MSDAKQTEARRVVGIDLGTTHCVVAHGDTEGGPLSLLSVAQHIAPGEVEARDRLASALYLPSEEERTGDALTLPWADAAEGPAAFVGEYAFAQGARVPGRQVVSAKSWLSYDAVDREAAILPWGAHEDVPRVSPVDAQVRYLEHIKHAFLHAEGSALADHDVVVTVPASFDEVARKLTERALARAGLSGARLLEEPQAAFYAQLADKRADALGLDIASGSKLVLVVDVGGGTTDLTLLTVAQGDAAPHVERIAVGEHLMLGGDNMDATLGRIVEQELLQTVQSLSASRWGQLVQAARLAKETLLSRDAPDEMGVTLAGRGRSLLGGAKTYALTRTRAHEILLDGFFPLTAASERVEKTRRAALSALGLPYERDPAIGRHVSTFLATHQAAAQEKGATVHNGLLRPDAVLLNGGVFNSPVIRERFSDILKGWYGAPVPLLTGEGHALDNAVALGAAYSARARRGQGVQIKAGAARGYFIGVKGADGGIERVAVVPRGLADGETATIARPFSLVLGKPVRFDVYASTTTPALKPGEVLAAEAHDQLTALPALNTVLHAPDSIPVQLHATVTDVGTLELFLQHHEDAPLKWQLDFSTRAVEQEGAPAAAVAVDSSATELPKRMEEAKDYIGGFYGTKKSDVDASQVKSLRRKLEKILGPRDMWTVAANRELAGVLIAGMKRRRRSADHERVFFQMLGYTLRPGFGTTVDEWRVGETWKLFAPLVEFKKESRNWAAFWIMWRRIAGGLDAEQQNELYARVAWHITPKSQREGAAPKGAKLLGDDEMVRMVATLERLDAQTKAKVGEGFLHQIEHKKIPSWWALGRIGTRQPVRGSVHDVVDVTTCERWLDVLLSKKWSEEEGASFCAAQLARMTGDRARDVSDELRTRVLRKFQDTRAPGRHVTLVESIAESEAETSREMLGDALPVGLVFA